MGFVKRRASTKAKVSIENFEEVKAQFLLDIKAVVEFEEIPFDLIINWDQTGINYVCTHGVVDYGKRRSKKEAGVDDKRQITAVFAGSLRRFPTTPADLQRYYSALPPNCLLSSRLAHHI